MSIELTMPRLSDTMENGTIIKWNVGVGDEVSAGDVVADIETDKATMEMQVFDDGVIAGLLVDPGSQVPVGTLIAVLAEEGEDVAEVSIEPAASTPAPAAPAPAAPAPAAPAPAAPAPAAPAPAAPAPVAPAATSTGRMKVSPVARRIAGEHGIDLARLQGSGPGGRIIKRDVLAAVDGSSGTAGGAAPMMAAAPAALASGEEALSGMRQTIARRLVESKTSIPHYQVSMDFDMESLLDIRSQVNQRLAPQGLKVSVNDFIVRASALAIHEHRYFNASFAGDRIQFHAGINIGVAIALPEERGGGLVVGTIRDADRLSVGEIGSAARGLSEKARTRGLAVEDMSDTTFTISNLGMFGVDHFTAIINPPNSAILACGAALEQPVVRDGSVVPGVRMTATLSLDHRVIDGAMAARYLQTMKQLIEQPAMLLV
jgi:pyruvate dehydrogenase E2 component (dihydrolipoamide acetyltransferase)